MKNFLQPGATLAFAPSTAVTAGTAVLIGVMLGVAYTDVAATKTADFAVTGVFELPKLTTANLTVGAQVYWDNTNKWLTDVAAGNTACGKVWIAAGNGTTKVYCKINA